MSTFTDGSMLHQYFVARFRAAADARRRRLASIDTRAAALRYRTEVRRKLADIFGPWPRRTPLNPRVTGVLQRRGYRVEKVAFESRPGYFVTANLYVPDRQTPMPAVIGNCGHGDSGKVFYQRFARGLAEHGFVVLIWDPVSQGERHQYVRLPKRLRPVGCVREHMMAGKQMSLVGEFFGTWHAWDGMRALDYLLSRPEVDRRRVGVTGNSGGGTLSTYLNALDDRYAMAAPSCFVTTYLANVENELPADNEQIPPGIVAAGLDLADFFIAQAPRPTILLGQYNDFFDVRGLRQTYDEVRRFYAVLGAADRVKLHVGPGTHGFQPDARRAMYRFFNQVTGQGDSDRESKRPVEPESTLWAAPRGEVANLPGNRMVHEQTAAIANQLAKRKAPSDAALHRAISQVLDLPDRPAKPCHYRVLRPFDAKASKRFEVGWPFLVETESNIQASLVMWEKRSPRTPLMRAQLDPPMALTLYIPHLSSESDVLSREVPQVGPVLYTIDPRGVGRSQPQTCDPHTTPTGAVGVEYFYHAQSLMLGESYPGRRVYDVLCVLDLLASRGARRVHLVGRGMGAITATFAACLHPVVDRVTLRHGPRSFHEWTQTPLVDWPMSVMPWGVLRKFDLPDCYRLLKNKRLRLIEPWGPRMSAR